MSPIYCWSLTVWITYCGIVTITRHINQRKCVKMMKEICIYTDLCHDSFKRLKLSMIIKPSSTLNFKYFLRNTSLSNWIKVFLSWYISQNNNFWQFYFFRGCLKNLLCKLSCVKNSSKNSVHKVWIRFVLLGTEVTWISAIYLPNDNLW